MAMSAFNWIDDLNPAARDAMLARARERALPDATILYRQGDVTTEFFQIVSGEIRKFVVNQEGLEVLIYIYSPGDVVADSSAIDRDPYPVTIATRGPTKLRVWRVTDFAELRLRHPEIDAALALQSSRRLRGTLLAIEEFVTMSVAARVASRIATLAELHGVSSNGLLVLSQSDLGLMVGTTRQSVNQIIHELKALQLIDTHYGKILIKDLPGLRRFATGSPRGKP